MNAVKSIENVIWTEHNSIVQYSTVQYSTAQHTADSVMRYYIHLSKSMFAPDEMAT